jgi:hypothetical protein
MNPAEVRAFLATQNRVVVAALDEGEPIGTIADAQFADDVLIVTLRAGDPVGELLAADDRVCVIAEQFPTYHEIKGVAAHGVAAPHQGPNGEMTFRLGLDDVTSFDFGKLPQAGEGSAPSNPR